MSRLGTFRGLIVLNNMAITMMENRQYVDSKRTLKCAIATLEREFISRDGRRREASVERTDHPHHQDEGSPAFLSVRDYVPPLDSIRAFILSATRRLIHGTAQLNLPDEGQGASDSTTEHRAKASYFCLTLTSTYADVFLDSNDDILFRVSTVLTENMPSVVSDEDNEEGQRSAEIDANARISMGSRVAFEQLLGMISPIRIEIEDYDVTVPGEWIVQTLVGAVLLFNLGMAFLWESTSSGSSRDDALLRSISQCLQWAKSTLEEFGPLLHRHIPLEEGLEEVGHSYYILLTSSAIQLEIIILETLVLVARIKQASRISEDDDDELSRNRSSLTALLQLMMLERSYWHGAVSGTRIGASAA